MNPESLGCNTPDPMTQAKTRIQLEKLPESSLTSNAIVQATREALNEETVSDGTPAHGDRATTPYYQGPGQL